MRRFEGGQNFFYCVFWGQEDFFARNFSLKKKGEAGTFFAVKKGGKVFFQV